MAHNIGQMFYVGEVPWHRLGRKLEGLADAETALRASGLDYTVSLRPLAVRGEPGSYVSQRMAVVRDDREPGQPGRVLGVVHPEFKLLQNREGVELFDALLGAGGERYNTGGYLKHGEVVWLQAQLGASVRVGSNDVLNTYLLFSNSHDGSYAIDIRITTVRVVCNNTLNFALRNNAGGQYFRRGHSGNYSALKANAERVFAHVQEVQEEIQWRLNRLAEIECTDADFRKFMERLLPVPAKPVTSAINPIAARSHETREMNILGMRDGIENVRKSGYPDPSRSGAWHDPDEATWWGALNAVTAWVDHVQPVDGDRFANLLLGAGDELKAKALKEVEAATKDA
jgi:phage/plasmid-like protein (TIGR03299 family)